MGKQSERHYFKCQVEGCPFYYSTIIFSEINKVKTKHMGEHYLKGEKEKPDVYIQRKVLGKEYRGKRGE